MRSEAGDLIEGLLRKRISLKNLAARTTLPRIVRSAEAVMGVNVVRACFHADDLEHLQEALIALVQAGATITAADVAYAQRRFPLEGQDWGGLVHSAHVWQVLSAVPHAPPGPPPNRL